MRAWLLVVLIGCNAPKGGPGPHEEPDSDGGTGTTPDPGTDDTTAVDADGDGFASDVDCDDADPAVYPGAPDVCGDGKVTDCDRTSDDGLVNVDGVGYGSLQDALDAASDGSELVLCPGTYVGTFVAGVPVRMSALEDATTTILSGPDGTVLSVVGGTEITGLTIRDGADGGLRLVDAGTLTVTGSTITANQARDGGGLQIAPGGTAVLVDTALAGNLASEGGGGAWVGAGGTLDLSRGSSATGNRARLWGGGVWLDQAHLVGGVLSGNTVSDPALVIYDNGAGYVYEEAWGGMAVALDGDGDVTGAEVTGNTGTCAAVSAVGGSVVLQDVSIHDNVGKSGGGVAVIGGTLTLQGTTAVVDNQASYGAGGYAVGSTLIGGTFSGGQAEWGAGVEIFGGELRGATILDNEASRMGGGIYDGDRAALTDLTVTGNSSVDGGGLVTDLFSAPSYATISVSGCTFSGNDADRGGGVFADAPLALTDSTISDNTATFGAGLYLQAETSVDGGAITGNVATDGAGGVEVNGMQLDVGGTDLGEGSDDNQPSDVTTGDGPHAYGVDATFTCDAQTCG